MHTLWGWQGGPTGHTAGGPSVLTASVYRIHFVVTFCMHVFCCHSTGRHAGNINWGARSPSQVCMSETNISNHLQDLKNISNSCSQASPSFTLQQQVRLCLAHTTEQRLFDGSSTTLQSPPTSDLPGWSGQSQQQRVCSERANHRLSQHPVNMF